MSSEPIISIIQTIILPIIRSFDIKYDDEQSRLNCRDDLSICLPVLSNLPLRRCLFISHCHRQSPILQFSSMNHDLRSPDNGPRKPDQLTSGNPLGVFLWYSLRPLVTDYRTTARSGHLTSTMPFCLHEFPAVKHTVSNRVCQVIS